MKIRICNKDDIKSLIDVSTRSYLAHYSYLWLDHGKNYVDSNFSAEKFHNDMMNLNSVFFLVSEQQENIGLVKLNIDSATENFSEKQALELERIYFVKEASGKGFGKLVIDFIVSFAKQKGKEIIWLKAMESSPAVGFYTKRGFEIVAETELDYPGTREQFRKMFLMHLVL
ncbi:MAG: GNAT family N-acetyltransferase [Bacteroidetes bacterium]|nr:GNAT family N-acetyltransferase [Bacteroidota bacterium]